MAAGKVDRNVLSSNYQEPGQTYDDKKTEGALEVVAQQIDENYDYAKSIDDYTKGLVTSGTLSPLPPDFLYRQAIINGNFDIWQRLPSRFVSNPAFGSYAADRWLISFNTDGGVNPNVSHSQSAMTPGALAGSYYRYRFIADPGGSGFGANASYGIFHRIEHGTRYLCGAGKKLTLSFYAATNIAGKKLGVSFSQRYGSGGAPSANDTITGQIITLTSTLTKYTVTIDTNTLSGKTFGTNNDDFIQIGFYYMWGTATGSTQFGSATSEVFSGATVDIAQVQVTSGDVALPFMPKSYEEELGDCQRYTIAYTDASISSTIGFGFALSTTIATIAVYLPNTMRVKPSLVATATDWQLNDGVTATDLTAIALGGGISDKVVTLTCTVAAGLTQFRPYRLIADGTADRLLILEAEV